MEFNWDEIEAEASANKNFKDYAPNGEHTVKVASVDRKDNGNGWFEIQFEEDEYKYPKMSFAFFRDEKIKYRMHYYKEVMKILGATEEQARKAVETCEKKGDRSSVHKAYGEAFGRLAKKNPQIKIEVRDQYDRDGRPVMSDKGTVYGESVFTKSSGLQFPSNGTGKNASSSNPLEGAEEASEDISLEELPF